MRSRVPARSSPVAGSTSSTTVRCGSQVGRGPPRDLLELGDVDDAAGALVREQGVDVAVGDDDHALGQRRQHDLVDVLGLVGGVDERLGPR